MSSISESEHGESPPKMKSMKSFENLTEIPKPSGSSPVLSKSKLGEDRPKSVKKSSPVQVNISPEKSFEKSPSKISNFSDDESLFKSSISEATKAKPKIPNLSKIAGLAKGSFDNDDDDDFVAPSPKTKTTKPEVKKSSFAAKDSFDEDEDDDDFVAPPPKIETKTTKSVVKKSSFDNSFDDEDDDDDFVAAPLKLTPKKTSGGKLPWQKVEISESESEVS